MRMITIYMTKKSEVSDWNHVQAISVADGEGGGGLTLYYETNNSHHPRMREGRDKWELFLVISTVSTFPNSIITFPMHLIYESDLRV